MQDVHNERLWRIARKRAGFKKSLFSYIIINIFLWSIWWFSSGRHTGFTFIPWPLWVMLGWGIGLAFQYFDAYSGSGSSLTEQEYEKLKQRQQP